jgi:hypothetical protein
MRTELVLQDDKVLWGWLPSNMERLNAPERHT